MFVAFVSKQRWEKQPEYVKEILGEPKEFDKWILFDSESSQMQDLAISACFFSSKSQARKNGWNGSIPEGYKEGKFGKNNKWWCFNVSPHWDDDEYWHELEQRIREKSGANYGQ